MDRKLSTDLRTLEKMVRLHCLGNHGGEAPCAGCRELLELASARLRACPMHPKPACKDCRAHCFPPELRRRIRAVMRYAGPRMALRHPLLALRHYLGF